MLTALLVAGVVAQSPLPDSKASPGYLAAWVLVAAIAGTPGIIAAVLSSRNRNETRAELQQVRHEVMPNGGSSSFDLLHRLAWETHERSAAIPQLVDRVEQIDARLETVEGAPCPFQPPTPTTEDR